MRKHTIVPNISSKKCNILNYLKYYLADLSLFKLNIILIHWDFVPKLKGREYDKTRIKKVKKLTYIQSYIEFDSGPKTQE